MTYTYLNLSFNAEAKDPKTNIHRVTYDSYSVELMSDGNGGVKPRYALLGTNDKGRKVAFYVSKTVLDGLKEGGAYAFQLSGNIEEGWDYQSPDKARRTYGVCRKKPKAVRPQKKRRAPKT